MIGKLTGTVDAIGESHLIIDVRGVGYEVLASSRTLRNLKPGETVGLTIDTHVREDAIKLYGFASELERTWFRALQNVQGVGAKVALAVLGILAPRDLSNAIAIGDAAAVSQAAGVGKKLALRITAELKDKAPALSIAGLSGATDTTGTASEGAPDGNNAAEAISALTNLGYQPAHASQAVAVACKDIGADADTAALIRRGLKELAR